MKKQVYKLGLVAFLGLSAMTFAQQDGTVGVNTDTPSATLDVKTKSGVTKSLRVENTAQKETFTLLNDGNLGLGVAEPQTKLHVLGGVRNDFTITPAQQRTFFQLNSNDGNGNYSMNWNTLGGVSPTYAANGVAARMTFNPFQKANGLLIETAVEGLKDAPITWVPSMHWATNGNVGIGKTDATEKLEVEGFIKSTALAGSGVRNVAVDAEGKLIVEAVSSGASNETLVISKDVKVVPNAVSGGNGLANAPADGKNIRNYSGSGAPTYGDSDYMVILTNTDVDGKLELPSASANPGRIIYLINGTTQGLGFSNTKTDDVYPFNFGTIAVSCGVGFVSTGKTWYPIGR